MRAKKGLFIICVAMFQTPDGTSRMETGNISPVAGASEVPTPTPPPPFDQHQTYKFFTRTPPRDSSPPPSYDEAVRAMTVRATSNTRDWHHTHVTLEPVPTPTPANLTPGPHPNTRRASSFSASPTSPLQPAPVIQTLPALTQQSECDSVPQTQPQASAALTQIPHGALPCSTVSQQPSNQMEEVS